MARTESRPVREMNGHSEESLTGLVSRASRQFSQLVREELRLAQAEMADKGKRFSKGGGLLGGAAVVGFVAFQAAVATAIALLALALPVWVSALIITGALLALAALLALLGRAKLRQAAPPKPERAIEGVKADVAEIKGKAHR